MGYKRMDLAPDELLFKVHVIKPRGKTVHFFRKVGTRQAQAISKVCLAAYARVEDGLVAEFRVGLGSVAPVPVRANHAEAVILGQPVNALPIERAMEAIQADISPIDDIRSTAHYRRVITGNVLGQALRELERAGQVS
jgi:CO/xanthine dehydrogenase FAD-binding subunit